MRIENDYRGRLWGRLRDRLWGRLWGRLRDRLRDRLGVRLWDRLEGRLWDRLWDRLEGRLGDSLWDRLGGRLEDANGDIVGHISDVGDGAMITQCANGWDALQSERDRLQEQVMLLRESLEEGKQLLATHPEVGIGNSKVHFCYHKFRAALEATKEGA